MHEASLSTFMHLAVVFCKPILVMYVVTRKTSDRLRASRGAVFYTHPCNVVTIKNIRRSSMHLECLCSINEDFGRQNRRSSIENLHATIFCNHLAKLLQQIIASQTTIFCTKDSNMCDVLVFLGCYDLL